MPNTFSAPLQLSLNSSVRPDSTLVSYKRTLNARAYGRSRLRVRNRRSDEAEWGITVSGANSKRPSPTGTLRTNITRDNTPHVSTYPYLYKGKNKEQTSPQHSLSDIAPISRSRPC